MKKMLILATLVTSMAHAAPELKCRGKYEAVSCEGVKEAKRTHLCLKYPKKLSDKKKVKWCTSAKKKYKKSTRV